MLNPHQSTGRHLLVLLAGGLLQACGATAPQAQPQPAMRSGMTAGASAHGAATTPTSECPAARIGNPSWTFKATSPSPDTTSASPNLSGRWIEVSPDAPPGPVQRKPYCYEGGAFVTLEHTNDTVTLSWAFVAHVVGPQRPPSPDDGVPYEAGRGTLRESQLAVDTIAAAPRGRCLAKHYALTLDSRGHLVGTRDGEALRLAPVRFDPEPLGGRSSCGPTPQ